MQPVCQCYRAPEDLFRKPQYDDYELVTSDMLQGMMIQSYDVWTSNYSIVNNECECLEFKSENGELKPFITARWCGSKHRFSNMVYFHGDHVVTRGMMFNVYYHHQPYLRSFGRTLNCPAIGPNVSAHKKWWRKWMWQHKAKLDKLRRIIFDFLIRIRNSSHEAHGALCKDVCILIYQQIFTVNI
jgi:hypothetical protein